MRLPRFLIKRMQSILSFLNWLNYSFRFSNAFKRRPRKMILICERKIVENVLRWTGKKNGRIKKWTKLLNVFFGSNHCRWTVKISKKNISPRHKKISTCFYSLFCDSEKNQNLIRIQFFSVTSSFSVTMKLYQL